MMKLYKVNIFLKKIIDERGRRAFNMKIYKKSIFVILTMITIWTSGCSLGNNHEQNIPQNKGKIGKIDTLSEETVEDESNNMKVSFGIIKGPFTLYYITAKEESDIVINFESDIEKGDFKVVLVGADDEIIDIFEGTSKDSKTIAVKEGESRIDIIGEATNGKVDINIEAGKNIEIKNDNYMD